MISELCASGRDRIFLPHLQRTEKQQQQYCTGKSCALFHFPPLCRHTKSRVVRLVHCVFFIRKNSSQINVCIHANTALGKVCASWLAVAEWADVSLTNVLDRGNRTSIQCCQSQNSTGDFNLQLPIMARQEACIHASMSVVGSQLRWDLGSKDLRSLSGSKHSTLSCIHRCRYLCLLLCLAFHRGL